MENKEKISDLGLATLLLTLQYELVGLERADEKRINFIFNRSDGFDEAVSNFWSNTEISISVQALFNNNKLLKNRLYSIK